MEEMSRQGQKVSAPQLPDSSTRWCWSVLLCPRCRVHRPASQHRARNVPLGRWRNCLGKGRRRAHICRFVRIHVGVGQRCRARDVESSTLQGTKAKHVTFQRGDGGQVREGSKGKHSHPAMSKSQARAQQSVSSRASSTGRWNVTQGSICRKAHPLPQTTHSKGQYSSGAMERYMRGFDLAQNSRSPATTSRQQ